MLSIASEDSPVTASASGTITVYETVSDSCSSTPMVVSSPTSATVAPIISASSVEGTKSITLIQSITETVLPVPAPTLSSEAPSASEIPSTSEQISSTISALSSNSPESASSVFSTMSSTNVSSTLTYPAIYPTGPYTASASSIVTAPQPINSTVTLPVGNATVTTIKATTSGNSPVGTTSSISPAITAGADKGANFMAGGVLGSFFMVAVAIV